MAVFVLMSGQGSAPDSAALLLTSSALCFAGVAPLSYQHRRRSVQLLLLNTVAAAINAIVSTTWMQPYTCVTTAMKAYFIFSFVFT